MFNQYRLGEDSSTSIQGKRMEYQESSLGDSDSEMPSQDQTQLNIVMVSQESSRGLQDKLEQSGDTVFFCGKERG